MRDDLEEPVGQAPGIVRRTSKKDIRKTIYYTFYGESDISLRDRFANRVGVAIVASKEKQSVLLDRPPEDYEGVDRVLAVGVKPDHLVDYAYCETPGAAHFNKAVAWTLGAEMDHGPVLIIDQLREIMGPGVREIPDDELRRERVQNGGMSTMLKMEVGVERDGD